MVCPDFLKEYSYTDLEHRHPIITQHWPGGIWYMVCNTVGYKLQIMRVPHLKFRYALLLAEQKFALLTGNERLQQNIAENMVMLNTQIQVQREKDINQLLFKL